jgi:hypothetical protein
MDWSVSSKEMGDTEQWPKEKTANVEQRGGRTEVEHLPRDPKINGLNPATVIGRGRNMGEKFMYMCFAMVAQWQNIAL